LNAPEILDIAPVLSPAVAFDANFANNLGFPARPLPIDLQTLYPMMDMTKLDELVKLTKLPRNEYAFSSFQYERRDELLLKLSK